MKKSKKFNKRLLSGVTSALLSLSCLISSLSPIGASAATVNSLGEGSGVDDVTLLVGENSGLRGETVDETIANADNTYALGIASQFSVFLRDDFEVTQSDTEGRLAVGGSIKATVDWYQNPGDGYTVGMGDYSSKTPLDTLLQDSGYAHIVWGAGGDQPKMTQIHMHSSYDSSYPDGIDYKTHYQTVAVESTNGIDHVKYESQNYTGYLDRFYDVSAKPIINFEGEFGKLASTSKTLAQRSSDKEFDLSKTVIDNDTVTLTYKGESQKAETVYFNLDETQWSQLEKANYVKFVDIPKLPEPRTVIDNNGKDSQWEYSYIVINSPAKIVDFSQTNNNSNTDRYTSINEEYISLKGPGTENQGVNNHIGTTSILYNFPSATDITLGRNFQGSVLAPDAAVIDADVGNGARGHLSGALIAKSFKGTTEFGFRSFTGPKGIIGGGDAYTIDIEKFDYDGKTPLGGAKIGIYKQDGTLYKSITSEEKATVTGIEPGRYYMQEISAPDGYALSSEKYYFEVKETPEKELILSEQIQDSSGQEVNNVKYVDSVTITVYSGGDYSAAVASAEYEPNNVNNSAYIIDGKTCTLTESGGIVTSVDGIEADLGKFKLFQIDTKEGNYIVTYDGKLVTPTVNLTENLDTKYFSFTDEKAITFRKVDASGSPLKGAAIEMTSGTVTVGGTAERPTYSYKPGGAAEGWAWNAENSVSAIIDYGNIGELKANGKTYENVYRIHETAVPSGTSYALGDDILILKYGGNIYWTNVANGANPSTFPLTQGSGGGLAESKNSGWNRIDGNTAAEDRVLTMENLEINGADAYLIKADTEGKILTGATIALYYDGEEDPIYTWENFSGSSSLIQDDGFRNIDNKHVIKGYLQPGIYYFVEKAAPQGYEVLNGNLYFTVANDGSVQEGKAEAATLEMPAGYLGNNSEYDFGEQYAGKKISSVDIEYTYDDTQIGWGDIIQFKSKGVNDNDFVQKDFTISTDGKISFDLTEDNVVFGDNGKMGISYWNCYITKLTFHLDELGPSDESTLNGMFEVLDQGGKDDKKYDLKIINNGSGTTTETTTSTTETTKKTTTTTTTTTKATTQTEKTTKSTSATTPADTTKKTTATTTKTTAATTVTTTTAAPVTSVKICKQDDMGSELPGAVLSLKGTDKNGDVIKFALQSLDLGEGAKSISSSGDELIWQSGSTPTYVLGIPDGEYVLTERSAPDGYEYAESITFVVENGEVTYVNGNKTSGNTVVMIDKVKTATETTTTTTTTVTTTTTTVTTVTTAKATDTSQATTAQSVSTEKTTTTTTVLTTVSSTTPSETCVVRICKQDSSGEEVAGATLDLRGVDKEGNEIVFADGSLSLGNGATAVRSGGTELEWVSGNSPTDVLNIPDGEYTLTEKSAPDGYEYAEQMTFVVENGKVVSVNGQPASDNTIVMIDELIITTTSETVTSTTEITTTTTTVDTPTGQRPGIVTTTSGDYGIGGGEFQNSTTTVATEVTGNVPNDGNGEFSKTTAATTPADTDSQQVTTTQTVPEDDTGTTTTTTTATSTATTAASTTAVTSTTVTSTTVTGTATGSSPGTGDTSPSVLMMMLSVSLLALTLSGLMKKKKDEHPDGS